MNYCRPNIQCHRKGFVSLLVSPVIFQQLIFLVIVERILEYFYAHCHTRYPDSDLVHLFSIPGVRPFKCDTCPKAYFQKSDLERHIKLQHLQVTTIGENGVIQKPFRCMECPKSFAQSCDLERHIRTHAGIRPYKCEQVSERSF